MSINGMRSAATATPPAPPATPGDTAADTKGATPGPGMNGEHRSELSERPPQPGSETAIPPRIALTKLGSVLPEQASAKIAPASSAEPARTPRRLANAAVANGTTTFW